MNTKMSSQAFVFLGVLFVVVLLVSSEVASRDLAQTSTKKDNEVTVETNGVEDAKYGGYDRGYGDHLDGPYGGGYGGSGRGHGGSYGCRHGRCGYRCSSYAGEVVEGAKP